MLCKDADPYALYKAQDDNKNGFTLRYGESFKSEVLGENSTFSWNRNQLLITAFNCQGVINLSKKSGINSAVFLYSLTWIQCRKHIQYPLYLLNVLYLLSKCTVKFWMIWQLVCNNTFQLLYSNNAVSLHGVNFLFQFISNEL